MSKYLARYSSFPKELFRLNNGLSVRIRDRVAKKTGSFDVLTEAGKLKPKALNPNTYKGPNGASMRPNTQQQKKLVQDFIGSQVIVYAVPKGTKLPDELTLVHERDDHYSLQPAKEMTLEEFDTKLNTFLQSSGRQLTREQWLQMYPEPTETE